jgi:hypothetical protein
MALNEYTRVQGACVLSRGQLPTLTERYIRSGNCKTRPARPRRLGTALCSYICAAGGGSKWVLEWRMIMTTPWLAVAGSALLLVGCASANSSATPEDEQADVGAVSEGEAIAAQLGYRVPRGSAQRTMGSGAAAPTLKPAAAP